jgi:diguanylate cyclase (GGDEF)-like protein
MRLGEKCSVEQTMIVADIMSEVKTWAKPDDLFSDVARSMFEQRCSCTLISTNGFPEGIVTERDIVSFFVGTLANQSTAKVIICEVMTKDPICLSESTPLYEAMWIARSHKVRHLPVVDSCDRIAGIVTQTDLVDAYVTSLENQVTLEKEIQDLKLLSNEDALMEIGNRRAMEAELSFAEASARRYKKNFAVALIDVDLFKKYNDYYGHQMGDKALQMLATAIKTCIRETDRIYRYGGEEILLLMPETTPEEALRVAERAREAVENNKLPHVESPLDVLTISVGVAFGGQEPWQSLVERADQSLYRAKDAGRNKVMSI